jgi:hypothetical protein
MDVIYASSLHYNEQSLCIFYVGHPSNARFCSWFWPILSTVSKRHLFTLFHYTACILYDMNRTENTASNSSYIVECGAVEGRLCGLVVTVPGYKSRGPGINPLCYQIFWEIVHLKRGLLSLVNITEELLEWKSSGSGSRKSRLTAVGIHCADHATPPIRKIWH